MDSPVNTRGQVYEAGHDGWGEQIRQLSTPLPPSTTGLLIYVFFHNLFHPLFFPSQPLTRVSSLTYRLFINCIFFISFPVSLRPLLYIHPALSFPPSAQYSSSAFLFFIQPSPPFPPITIPLRPINPSTKDSLVVGCFVLWIKFFPPTFKCSVNGDSFRPYNILTIYKKSLTFLEKYLKLALALTPLPTSNPGWTYA